MLRRGGKQKERPTIRVLIECDLENIWRNLPKMPPPERLSLVAGFDRLIKEIAEQVGEIINVFIFVPPHLAIPFGPDLHKLGFTTILCPKVEEKATGAEVDTVDEELIKFGQWALEELEFTHLCLISGDRDFAPLIRQAVRKKKEIIVAAADRRSLAIELIQLVRLAKGKIFIFSPVKD